MPSRHASVLRTRLRAVNMEFSALVRDKSSGLKDKLTWIGRWRCGSARGRSLAVILHPCCPEARKAMAID